MEYNNNLEEDLKQYCITRDSDLFGNNLYQPLCNLAASICSKYKIKKDLEVYIQDMVSHASVILPDNYEGNASCKGLVYMIMQQYLLKIFRYNTEPKRNENLTVYIEDLDNKNILTELNINMFEVYKNTLLENKHIIKKLKTPLQKKIAKLILKIIESNLLKTDDYVDYICIKAKCKNTMVYDVINSLKALLSKRTLSN